jgi:DDE family transposase
MPHNHYKVESDRLQTFLESCAKQVGQASGFARRTSKVNSAIFAQTLILSCMAEPEASLNQMVQWSEDLGVQVSAQGLDKRLTQRAVDFLSGLLEQAVSLFRRQAGLPSVALQQFSSILIVDSSQVALPDCLRSQFAGSGGNAAAASLKFHLSFDYLAGHVNGLEVVAGRSPDQKCTLHRQQVAAGSLQLFDLGYFEQTVLSDIAAAAAYFVCRLHPQVGVYLTPTAPHALDVAEWLSHLAVNEAEIVGYVGHKTRLPVRLALQRLPPSVVEERRRKAYANAQRRGKTYSQSYLTLLEWTILITNVPPSWLSWAQVMALYGLRWQIELIFKVWKSQAKLASVGQWRPQRVLCHLYARLLALVLFHWLVAPWRFGEWGELSWPKAFQVFQRHASRLADTMRTNWQGTAEVLEKMTSDFLRFACKDNRRKSPSSFQAFIQAEA